MSQKNIQELRRKQSEFERKKSIENEVETTELIKKEPVNYVKWIIVFLVAVGLIFLLFLFKIIHISNKLLR